MLRITAQENSGTRVCLWLEGRLIGPWVEELEAAVRAISLAVSLDLSGIHFVDARGLRLLHRLVGEGVIAEVMARLRSYDWPSNVWEWRIPWSA